MHVLRVYYPSDFCLLQNPDLLNGKDDDEEDEVSGSESGSEDEQEAEEKGRGESNEGIHFRPKDETPEDKKV